MDLAKCGSSLSRAFFPGLFWSARADQPCVQARLQPAAGSAYISFKAPSKARLRRSRSDRSHSSRSAPPASAPVLVGCKISARDPEQLETTRSVMNLLPVRDARTLAPLKIADRLAGNQSSSRHAGPEETMAPDEPRRSPRTSAVSGHAIGRVRRFAGAFADPANCGMPDTQAGAGHAPPRAEMARRATRAPHHPQH